MQEQKVQSDERSQVLDWRQRVILGSEIGPTDLPPWLETSYATLRESVMHPRYPCYFGTQAERRGEMFYSYVRGKDIALLPDTMRKFAELSVQPQYQKNNIAIFFEPDSRPLSHAEYHGDFWKSLQYLHEHDRDPAVLSQPDPADPAWEFTFASLQMFVVCACPSFRARHSRNLGAGMVLLFQPRSVFVDKVTNRVIGAQARNEVRRRLLEWDELPAHPSLGFYGDPGNLEWQQYFLPDDNSPQADRCPFLSRRASSAEQDSISAKNGMMIIQEEEAVPSTEEESR
ncbi:YqcI/YcgG family protein [Bordetella sp. LUAb4]|uniref:YqcI/YcgG family protein n=1 Tax=Bordetella sp. LUAb4 TaxID=2843195 RepID=UPI001E56E93A|nr:YqcI/YcgG family protein [Bordetella sp. LUAb4]